MTAPAPIEVSDVQGNILRGYGHDHAAYVFVTVTDAAAGRRLLADLEDPITTAEEWVEGKPDWCCNVALTAAGLEAVGVPHRVLETFPDEFRDGMAARAALLGDVDVSDPGHWEVGLGTGDAHVLVVLHARDEAVLAERRAWLDGLLTDGLSVVNEQTAATLPEAREHFGFADGFAQPDIEGSGAPSCPGNGVPLDDGGWRPLKTGEFLLGYEDEDGGLPATPARPLHRNATFMVYRKIAQDVALWRSFLDATGADFPGGPDRLAAKIVGRWQDGTPLVGSPDGPDPAIAADRGRVNDFRFADDPDGFACPLGAHVRRAYPRDAFGWGGVMSVRHRLIRRGMPYGPLLAAGAPEDAPADAPDDDVERGLVFVCFQASIARQFEIVQAQWFEDGNAFGLGHDKDFLLGDERGSGKMTINGEPPSFIGPQQRFTTVRGGEYLYMPGMAGLRALAAGVPA